MQPRVKRHSPENLPRGSIIPILVENCNLIPSYFPSYANRSFGYFAPHMQIIPVRRHRRSTLARTCYPPNSRPTSRAPFATRAQDARPAAVGSANAAAVHFQLCDSLRMVIHVVEHGQCISENSIVHTAVTHVQPFCTNSVCSAERSFISTRLPVERYAMMMMGTTISLAGKPRINASRITPSRPKKRAAGSKNAALRVRSVWPSSVRFAMTHISMPAGAATIAARPRTNSVRSKMERTITLPICGLR